MGTSELSIYYQNVRGLRTKTNSFLLSLASTTFDIIVLTETWLDSDINDSELFDCRYTVYRCDRNKQITGKTTGGGVLVAVHKKHKSQQIQLEVAIDMVTVKINARGRNLILIGIYFPPRTLNQVYDDFFGVLENSELLSKNESLIIGDFNLSEINGAQYDLTNGNEVCKKLQEFMSLFNIRMLNNVQNQLKNKTLDLVISSISFNVSHETDALVPEDNYHPALLITCIGTNNRKTYLGTPQVNRYNYKKANFLLLYELLKETNWNSLELFDEINSAVDEYYKLLYAIIDVCVPKVNNKKRQKYPIWFSNEIIADLKLKKYHHKRKNASDYHLQEFRRLRTKTKASIANAYHQYIESVENEITVNVNGFWNFVNTKKADQTEVHEYYYQGQAIATEVEAVQSFANYFRNVYNTNSSYNIESLLSESNQGAADILIIGDVDCEVVGKALKELKPKKAAGPDLIPPYVYKACWEFFKYPLTVLFNLSLKTSKFPAKWKVTRVTPIHKSGNKSQIENYRPISVLSTPAKIFEQILYRRIFPSVKNLICDEQHGFMANRSTDTNLITFTETLTELLDSGGQVDVIYTDFAKAFDKVNHDILLIKLYSFGMPLNLIYFFKSYLKDRQQFVNLHGIESQKYFTPSGVPQGSNLGPLFFLLFINDLPLHIEYSQALLFADDLKIFRNIDNAHDGELLQRDLDSVMQWSKNNKLYFNVDKCKAMTYTRKKVPVVYNYYMNSNILENISQAKDLGVWFTSDLKFDKHINFIVNSSLKSLGFLKRNTADFKSIACIKILYNSLVRSKLEYACKVWDSGTTLHRNKVETVQNKFLKYLYYKKYGSYPDYDQYHWVRCLFNIIKLTHRRDIAGICFIHKLVNNRIDCPKLLPLVNLYAPAYRTKPKITFFISRCYTNLRRNSPMVRMISASNSFIINSNINIFNTSVSLFKSKIITYFFNKYYS